MVNRTGVTRRRLIAATMVLALGGAACSSAAPAPPPPQQPPAKAPAAPPTPAPAATASKPAPTVAAKPTVAPTPIQPVKWRVGMMSAPVLDNVFRTIGIKRGFYKEAGIDVEFIRASNVLQNKALIAGELESIDLAIDGILAAVEQGAALKIVGSVNPGLPFAIYARRDIRSVADLAGRTVGMDNPGGLPHTVTRALLANAGVPEDRVTFVSLGRSGLVLVEALKMGKIDAFTNPIDWVEQAKTDPDMHVIGLVPDILPRLIRTAITVKAATAQSQGDVLVRFLTATLRSARYANENKAEAIAEAEQITQLSAAQLEPVYDWYRAHKMWSLNLELDPKGIEYMQELNIMLGVQQRRLPVDSVLDLSFQKKALAQVGEYKG